jgi:hypothetical protein
MLLSILNRRRFGASLVALAVVLVCGIAASQAVVTQIPGVLYTSGSLRRQVTPVTGSTYQVIPGSSDFLSVTAPPCTITLPKSDAVTQGDTYEVADSAGTAGTNNITIQGNGTTINGLSSYTINTNFGYVELIRNGTEWSAQAGTSAFTPAGAASGDLGGTYPSPTVTAITGTAGVANVRGTSALSFGTTPAQSGKIRLGNTDAITFRNHTNGGDQTILGSDASDIAYFGDVGAAGTASVMLGSSMGFYTTPSPTAQVAIATNGITVGALASAANLTSQGNRSLYATTAGLVQAASPALMEGQVQTANASATTVITFAAAASTNYQFLAYCVSAQTNGTAYSDHVSTAGFRRNGSGAATQVGTTTSVSSHASGAQAISFATSTNNVLLQVTGIAATTINWNCDLEQRNQAGQ